MPSRRSRRRAKSAKSKACNPGLWVRRRSQRVRFGYDSKSKSNGDLGSWREVFGSPAKSKLVGRRQWALSSSSLSLSLSLFAHGRDLTHTLSLSVFWKMVFEGKIKTEIILHHKHVRTEKHFQKMYFSCTIKYSHLRKSISGNHFQPILTQPKFSHCFRCI